MTDIVTVYAPTHYDMYDSYGLIACQLVRHLDALGVVVNPVALGEAQHANQPADIAEITNRPLRASFGGLLLGYPTGYHEYTLAQYGPRVAVTMFESSKIHPDWVPILNTVDAVVVPSRFCLEAFQACGVTAPVHVVPLGISEVYQPYERPSNREPFTFLAWLDRGKRKGGFHALSAFSLAFGDSPDVRLLLKARENVVNGRITNDNIQVIERDMTEAEMYELFKSADCMVNPNLGEGFGLIPREASATGCITLATNWGGTADDLEMWGWPIPHTLNPADWQGIEKFKGVDLGDWAEPDVPALAHLMEEVMQNREQYQGFAMQQAENIHNMYSWRRFATAVYEIWKEVAIGHAARAQAVLG